MKRILGLSLFLALSVATAALGDRKIIGNDDDEQVDAGPPPAKPDAQKPDDKSKKPDAAKPDDKGKKPDAKADDKSKKPDAAVDPKAKVDDKTKKPDAVDAKAKPDDKAAKVDDKSKKPEDAKVKKVVDDKRDVLADTPADKVKKDKDADARDKAEKAADDAQKKKEEEQKRLLEAKKAADDKRKLENKDQRLAAAKRIRQISRASGALIMSFAVEPGYVQSNGVVEVRMDLVEKLEVPDPRYGTFMPLKNLDLVAVLTQPGKGQKLRYALHALDAPGRYGFHTTPLKDGAYLVSVEGTTKDNKSVSASFPLHVGTWPPPDFEDEEKLNQNAKVEK